MAQGPGSFCLSSELSDEQGPGRRNVDSRQTDQAHQLPKSESLSLLLACPEMMDETRGMVNKHEERQRPDHRSV